MHNPGGRLSRAVMQCPLGPPPRRADSSLRSIEIVLARNPYQREEGVAASVGQGSAHPMRRCHVAHRAHRPFRGDPFARRMGEHGGEGDQTGRLVDGRSLENSDLMLAESLADDLEAARKRGVAETALRGPCPVGPNNRGQRLFRVAQLGLRLGEPANDSLDRCMDRLRCHQVERHPTRSRAAACSAFSLILCEIQGIFADLRRVRRPDGSPK
jgi:hypothetical protein